MMTTTILGVFVLLLLTAQLQPTLSVCSQSCSTGEGWNSNIRVTDSMSHYVVVTWDQDTPSSSYVVQYRQQQGAIRSFVLSQSTTALTYNITDLMTMVDYEVQVCRATTQSSGDDCGNCLLCFTTPAAQEPPGVPSNVRIQVFGAETVNVQWDNLETEVTLYHVLCVDSVTGMVDLNRTRTPASGAISDDVTGFTFSPNTTYNCSVAASNDFGMGSFSPVVQATTPPRNTAPGLLLIAYSDRVDFTQISEDVITLQNTYTENAVELFSAPQTAKGLDFHFEHQEIYYTTADRKVMRVNVTFTETASDLSLSVPIGQNPELILSVATVDSLGSLAVDWVYDELYWLEFDNSGSRIMRGVLSEGGVLGPYCVVDFLTDIVGEISVDPVHGYFYWNDANGLYRVQLSSVRVNTPKSSCSDTIQERETLIDSEVVKFTIESADQIYLIRRDDCFPTEYSLSAIRLGEQTVVSYFQSLATVTDIASYTEVAITPESSDFVVNRLVGPAVCPNAATNVNVLSALEVPNLVVTYRSAQQPQPTPILSVSDVRVTSMVTSATITWNAALFVGSLFSPSAYSEWDYIVEYRPVGSITAFQTETTTGLTVTLSNLLEGTAYVFNVIARGTGGETPLSNLLVFKTKTEASITSRLLVATQTGVITSAFDGSNAQCVDTASQGSIGVAYDSYTDVSYWAIDGSQGKVVSSSMEGSLQDLYSRVPNPFSLKLDWVARRLFWVQDGTTLGSHSIMSAVVGEQYTVDNAQVFQPSTDSIETTAMDSLNGFLFWVSDTTINRKSLSGLDYPSCYVSPTAPTALTVDPVRQRLYWLTNDVSSVPITLSVNQLEYNTTDCVQSITARDLSNVSFSSSATVLVYASDTLFIASQRSDIIYTIPSTIEDLSPGQQFAVSTLELSSVCNPELAVSIQDIAIISTSIQPLPFDLNPSDRGLSAVTPQPVPSPPTLGSNSTTTDIIIEWESAPNVAPLSDSPTLYLVEYNLESSTSTSGQMITVDMTSLTLMNQQPSTTVTSQVTACSVWQCSQPTLNTTFMSPPDFPGQVTNVRVFVYRPLANENVFTALVVWDAPSGSVVDWYTVTVSQDGIPITEVYQPTGNLTYHNILQRSARENVVTYFLGANPSNTVYNIQITAVNPTGDGPVSPSVAFNVTGPNYPQQVLALGLSGPQVVGMETTLFTPPSIPPSSPVVVDTVIREVYYYDRQLRSIIKSSLFGGTPDPLLLIDSSLDVLALAYDWIALDLYYVARSNMTGALEFYKVFVNNRETRSRLFPNLPNTVSTSTTLELTVDPINGFLFWIQADGSSTQLHMLDLRVPNTTSSTTLSSTSRRRKRQAESLSSINLSPALTLDPMTGNMIVCSATTGDIYSCNVTTGQCNRVVDAESLRNSSGMTDIGLPATSIAIDDTHIYWNNDVMSGVFAIERSDPNTLVNLSNEMVSSVFGLSPGSQPLGSQECLTPVYRRITDRPVAQFVTSTNTTVTLEWDAPTLPNECDDVVFSSPFLTYEVYIRNPSGIVELHGTTLNTHIVIEGLEPFTDYQFQVAGLNLYTLKINEADMLGGLDTNAMTTEGVPEPPINILDIVFGTASVALTWTLGNLKGPMSNLNYYISTANGELSANVPMITLSNVEGLIRGQTQDIRITTFNGVFNSSAAVQSVVMWPLAPAPTVDSMTNTSVLATVQLSSVHSDIESISLMYCITSSTSDVCNCPESSLMTNYQDVTVPTSLQFNLSNLTAFTQYCLQPVSRYRLAQGDTPEITNGLTSTTRTDEGVPDAPESVALSIAGLLSWTAPADRDSGGIIRYQITGIVGDNGSAVVFEVVESPANLQGEESFVANLDYQVNVRAVNQIGSSLPSNSVSFQRTPTEILTLPAIIGIAVGSAVIISLCLCFIFFCVWFVRLSRSKEQEIRSLSYMYGPDHELSNLRSAYRNTQAQNPHYTWSREDYVCTDEDLDLLSKFPRHNLKLENFIDRGEFGEVYQGTAIDILGLDTGPTPVAVKTLRKGATIDEQKKFLSEASLMSNFNHPNIVRVLGVCLDNDPVYIIMELMPAGDLLKFLREAKKDHGPALLTLAEQVQVTLDVAHGCRYLEQQHFIHRDIAARNCLVTSKGADRVVKIGDFGLAKDLYSSDYYQVEGQRKLPVRWMAPEALLQGKFTVESDIWSFGVLLWEIMSLGNQPYPGRINQEVLQFVTGGGRLDKPEKCPSKLYHLMQNCWKRYASERPHFDQIATLLSNFLDRIKRPDSVYYSDSDSDTGVAEPSNLNRQSSGKTPTRTPSFKSGFMNLARTGSMKLRNSFRRHGSIHKRDENNVSQLPVSSSENLIASDDSSNSFRERGPF